MVPLRSLNLEFFSCGCGHERFKMSVLGYAATTALYTYCSTGKISSCGGTHDSIFQMGAHNRPDVLGRFAI